MLHTMCLPGVYCFILCSYLHVPFIPLHNYLVGGGDTSCVEAGLVYGTFASSDTLALHIGQVDLVFNHVDMHLGGENENITTGNYPGCEEPQKLHPRPRHG